MTEEQIKEQLAHHFIGALASQKSVKVIKPFDDHGVDILLKKVKRIQFKNKVRYLDSGEVIAVQLRACLKFHRTDNQ